MNGNTVELVEADKSEIRKIKALYLSAFPKEERAPFRMLRSRAKRGRARMLAARQNGEFIGFAYLVGSDSLMYLFYLAVTEDKRGGGLGAAIIAAIIATARERYKNGRIFLAREQLDESADNYDMRVRRHGFYLRNGFEDLPLTITEGKVTYDVMGMGGSVSPEEYGSLITAWTGKFLKKFVDMRLEELK